MDAAAAAALLWQLIILITSAAAASSVHPPQQSHGGCVAVERAALLTFAQGITADPLSLLGSWQSLDCCQWNGVRCSNRTGHVVKLDLRNTFFWEDQLNLYLGNPHGMQGQVSTSLLALQRLKYLDLSGNSLGGQGVPIPSFLGSLKTLTYLNLSCIDFYGGVPPQLGNLTRLLYLDLNSIYYPQQLYSSDVSWLRHLSSLEHLDLSGVNLTTASDWAHVVNMLPSLRILKLQGCGLSMSKPPLLHSNLTALEELDLSSNNFNGPLAPNWFWDINTLRTLNLQLCSMYGSLPDNLGNMTALQVLDMQGNDGITGMLPQSLRNLCNLQEVVLTSTNLGGDITQQMERLPKCAWDKLQWLSLDTTNMTGNLPVWLGNLSRLEVLGVSNNHLSGTVPLGLGALTNLSMLYLDNNNFSGVITEDHLANLRNLIIIDLSYTSLQISVDSAWTPPFRLLSAELTGCQLGPGFPALFRQQKGITSVDISNTGIADAIPSWFWEQISYASFVYMSQNQIDGELPEEIEAMTWQVLRLNSNKIKGSIPQLLRNITRLDISRNSLSGPLPSNFQAPELQALVLFSNNITGSVPQSICHSRNMAILDLSNNLLVGELPRCMPTGMVSNASAGFSGLKISTLLLSNNSLSGEFPTLLRNNKNIVFLDLAKNNFHGNLPGWVGDLSALVIFRIRSNMFSGYIPSEITELENLHFLDLAHNNISGMIPQSLATLRGMTSNDVDPRQEGLDGPFVHISSHFGEFMDFEWFHDSLFVTIKGRELPYDTELMYMVSIDLSSNNLDGNVPEEVGSLVGLINLNLSFNHLTGNIPYQIGTLQLLESLDLSHNQLSGDIPETLSNLTSLGDLNLSYNSLTGRIPSGPQLDTLHTDDPASMYIANPGLCGYPLPNNCTDNNPIREDNHDRSIEMYLLLGMFIGFVAGLWLVFCAFLFKKSWRITYFRLFDDIYDQVYVFVTVMLATSLRKSGRT